MPGRHRLTSRRTEHTALRRAVEVVDAHTFAARFLTNKTLAAGRHPKGRDIALCGQDVLPASLAEAGRGRRPSCISIPTQRSGMS
jgi:hypothetical protein